MNLLSYDEIFRTLLIGLVAATNIIVAYYLIAIPMDGHIKQLESKLDAWERAVWINPWAVSGIDDYDRAVSGRWYNGLYPKNYQDTLLGEAIRD